MEASQDTAAIIEQLKKIKGISEEEAAAVDEACDILYDYDAVCENATRMTLRYETKVEAVEKANQTYYCPICDRRIHVPDAWCHWCGQRIKWSSSAYDDYKQRQRARLGNAHRRREEDENGENDQQGAC